MPPESDGDIRTIGCSLDKFILHEQHANKIKNAVLSTHKATLLVSELLNIHIRRSLQENPTSDLSYMFNRSWILNAYNEVTTGKRKIDLIPELHYTKENYMPDFIPPSRLGIQQCLLYDAGNMATVAENNIWMHFGRRVLSHVRRVYSISKEEYNNLTIEERKQRKLELLQVGADLCTEPSSPLTSKTKYHAWIQNERIRLKITNVFDTQKKKVPFMYMLKKEPYKFIYALYVITKEKEENGCGSFSLFPLRRTLVPRHVRFDQKAIRDLLLLGQSEYIKERSRKRRLNEEQISCKRTKEEMEGENIELFNTVVNMRAIKHSKRYKFDFAFSTVVVCVRGQMRRKSKKYISLNQIPKRGL